MSNECFPKLPGMTWAITETPSWSTIVQRSKNGSTTRLMTDPYPLWKFELSYEFLSSVQPQRPGPGKLSRYSELDQIIGFFNARAGSFDDFLLDPGMLSGHPEDSAVHGGPVGTGDGETTVFYLGRDCGGFVDEVQNPVGTIALAVNGVILPAVSAGPVTNWTLGAAGAVTFATPPALNAVITWDGSWRHRVRFAEDAVDLKRFMLDLTELQSVKLEGVKL